MKSTGVTRKIDELGRIVLPAEIRKAFDLEIKDTLEIFTEEDKIILKKYTPGCTLCGNMNRIILFDGKRLCSECVEKIKSL